MSYLGIGAVVAWMIGLAVGIPFLEDLLPIGLAFSLAWLALSGLEKHWERTKRPYFMHRKVCEDRLAKIAIALGVWILLSHLAGMIITWPLRNQFRTIAAGPSFTNRDGSLNFGGKIDDVVAKRRTRLRGYGFVGLGVWYVPGEEGRTVTSMVYLWVGPLRWIY